MEDLLIPFSKKWDFALACPKCTESFNYIHIESVGINRDGLVTEVSARETREYIDKPPGRPLVWLNLWCENGHTFRVVFQNHKGVLFVRAEDSGDWATEIDEHGLILSDWPDTL